MAWLAAVMLATPIVLLGAFVAQSALGLLRNYAAARKIGVPIRVIPISQLNPLWVLLDQKVLPFVRRLPIVGNSSFTRYNWRGWELADRYHSHQEMGDIWVLVSPYKNWIYINDLEAINTMFRRGNDFIRPAWINSTLEVFGPNISTATGQAWKTQRKIAQLGFNEQNNEIVWHETLGLARDIRRYWASKPAVDTIAIDLRTLSLHVLSRAGVGKSSKFESREDQERAAVAAAAGNGNSQAAATNYKQSLQTILEYIFIIILFGTKFLSQPWLPKRLRGVYAAHASFRAYLTATYEEEKAAYAAGRTTDSNLMRSIIRASQAEAQEAGSGGLTEAEIYGNMFVFNFAGHDTTAHTLTFAMFFLAAHPHVQGWLGEEIDRVLPPMPGDGDGDGDGEWDYRASFPRLLPAPQALPRISVRDAPLVRHRPRHQVDRRQGPAARRRRQDVRAACRQRRHAALRRRDERSPRVGRRLAGMAAGAVHPRCQGRLRGEGGVPHPRTRVVHRLVRGRVLDLIENDSGAMLLLQMLHPGRAPLVWRRE